MTTFAHAHSGGNHNGEGGVEGGGGGGGDNGEHHGVASLYALCARVPLIKSPNVRVPPPVTMPQNVHPLPSNVQEYFVYPFNLERFVLDEADRREQARRQDMQRRAPGWNEGAAGVLQPTPRQQAHTATTAVQSPSLTHDGQEVDEIAKMLDRLEQS